jgi:hypothetical protein
VAVDSGLRYFGLLINPDFRVFPTGRKQKRGDEENRQYQVGAKEFHNKCFDVKNELQEPSYLP